MFRRTVYFFLFLWIHVNIAKSITLTRNSSEIQAKYHSLQNGRMQKAISTFKNGKPRARMKMARRSATVIVNDDFDISSEIYNHENSSETGVLDEYEGSGIDEFEERESSKTTVSEDKLRSEYLMRTSSAILTTQTNRNATIARMTVHETKISTLSDEESSGDGILPFTTKSSTTEVTTQSLGKSSTTEVTPPSRGKPGHGEEIPDICLNSTCSANDLSVFASDPHRSIAEGLNFTLSCKSNNSSHMLFWYKSNGSVNFLKAFGTENELNLNLLDTKPIHSGKYMCVRWVDKQTCCNLQSDLLIYELPPYQYHLIIIGLIAAVCLFICVFFSVRHVISLKTYTKQFAEKHGNVKNQLL